MPTVQETAISDEERKASLVILNAIIRTAGDTATGDVTALDMHRLVSFIAGAILETDTTISAPSQFRKAGAYIGELIAHHARTLRLERENTGIGVMDLALAMGDPMNN